MATFLLEIRTEEIPAAALPSARTQLEERLGKGLSEAGFGDAEITVMSTSRRLAVQVAGLPERQPDREEEMTGPPVRVAVASDGSPTKAGEGFARKVGLPFDQIERVETDKGEYLAATVTHEGRATSEILAEILPGIVSALRFPKMMRWGDGSHQFVRPVHGVVALLQDVVVPLELFGKTSGRSTVGHRVHSPEAFDLERASDYEDCLAERSVTVDQNKRLKMIEALAQECAKAEGAVVHADADLVAEHVELVEWPGLLAGRFPDRYLELPPEVVVTTLRYHQKCLVLEDEAGQLSPGFLAVADRRDDPEGLVRQGNEWVIGARLADAEFFFNEDRKRTMSEVSQGLDRLEFHRVLGSLEDKAARVGEVATAIVGDLGLAADPSMLKDTARLAKTDLLTNMVVEFPELQGVMGGHYLRLEGADSEVWEAVRDHYQPVGFDGSVPSSDLGRLIGVADRLETVAGLFAVGERPSGSKDPFGLRRAAQGAVKIVVESGWDLDLQKAVAAAVASVATYSDQKADDLSAAVTDFVAHRVRRWMTDVVGVAGDTADAVMAVGWTDLPNAVARARALERARQAPGFRSLALAFKRVRNITEGQPVAAIDSELFDHTEERQLHEATTEYRELLQKLLPENQIAEAFDAMAKFSDVLERFFVEVLVMCEDERVRSNRIALLKNLGLNFEVLADLSKLQVEGGEN